MNKLHSKIKKNNILILGVGGTGINIIKKICSLSKKSFLNTYNFLIIDSDLNSLNSLLSFKNLRKMQIGNYIVFGKSTKGYPKWGDEAICNSKEDLQKELKGIDTLFLITNLSGGIGVGATPQIIEIARNKSINVITLVVYPLISKPKLLSRDPDITFKVIKDLSNNVINLDQNKMSRILLKENIKDIYDFSNILLAKTTLFILNIIKEKNIRFLQNNILFNNNSIRSIFKSNKDLVIPSTINKKDLENIGFILEDKI